MTDFYLFRHGETDMNAQTRWQGRGIDSELNANGENQARALAENLKGAGLEIIYASPLKRALKTAQIVGESLNVPVVEEKGFMEASLGDAEGLKRAEIKEKFPKEFAAWHNLDDAFMDARFPNGQSKREIQKSMVEALIRTAENCPARKIGVASHSAVLRYFMLYLGLRMPAVEHGTPIVVHYENGVFSYDENNPLYVREIEPFELNGAVSLVKDVFMRFEAPTYSARGVRTFLEFIAPQNLTNPQNDIALYGCFRGAELIGVAGTRGENHLCLLFVKENRQGKGAGKMLLRAAAYRAKNWLGKDCLTVNSAESAVSLYEKRGFKATDGVCERDGIRFVSMRLDL